MEGWNCEDRPACWDGWVVTDEGEANCAFAVNGVEAISIVPNRICQNLLVYAIIKASYI